MIAQHLYQPDATIAPDHRDERPWCALCPLPKANAVHEVPERDPDEAAVTARILGEETE